MNAIATALCDCLRLDARTSTDLTSLTQPDWAEVITLARKHGVSVVLYRSLKARADEIHPPADVIATLHEDSKYAFGYSLRYENQLSRVLQALHSARLPVIILKGAYLAEHVYEQKGERLMGDLDLLAQYKDLRRAVTVLETLDYRPNGSVSVKNETRVLQHLQPLTKKGALGLEIHWTLVSPKLPAQFDLPGLWQRAVPVKIGQVQTLALAPEDLLLHLCCHTAYHHTFEHGLRSLVDIAYVVRRFSAVLDWDEITRRAHATGIAASVYLAVSLAVELLGAPVPAAALGTLHPDGFDDQAVSMGKELLFADQSIIYQITPDLARAVNKLPFLHGVKVILERIFLPKTLMAAMYHVEPDSPKLFFCYWLRFRDVWKRYKHVGWGLLRGDPSLTTTADQVNQLVKTQERLRELLTPGH